MRLREFTIGLAIEILPLSLQAAPLPAEIYLSSLEPANGGDGSLGVVFQALTPDSQKGYSVAPAGDINGDLQDDLLIGAPGEGLCPGCASYLVYGRSDFAATFDLVQDAISSGGADGFVIQAPDVDEDAGTSVSNIGDLNADGYADFVVGAPYGDPDGAESAGEAFVVFGRATGFPAFFALDSLLPGNGGDGSAGFALYGVISNQQAGQAVSGGCDVNADGIDDLVIGAPNNGRAYVVYGRTSGFPPEFGLARLLPPNGGDGTEGVAIEGMTPYYFAGRNVACVKDASGDGIDDLFIGAPYTSPFPGFRFNGESYLVLGRAQFPAIYSVTVLRPENGGDGSEGTIFPGTTDFDLSGWSVASAGDMNQDGIGDLFIGVPSSDPNDIGGAGRAFVIYGRSRWIAELELASLVPPANDGTQGFVLNGIDVGDQAGISVAPAGDVNADGLDDIIVGAPSSFDTYGVAGEAYVLYGNVNGMPASFELSTLLASNGGDGSAGFVVVGDAVGDSAGLAVAGAGDVNGDGATDILIGAPYAQSWAGKAYLVYGAASDSDGDGVPQSRDNCTELANADQRDTDSDGIGNACDADLDNNCNVNFLDLGILKGVFFTSNPDADFNGDGSVNFVDLGIMREGFFLPPGPSGVPNACEA